jgi:hypothetical protein
MNKRLKSFITHAPLNGYVFVCVGVSFGTLALLSILVSIGKIAGRKSVDLIK